MMPYVCEGTIVKTLNGRDGKVVGVDRKNKIAVIYKILNMTDIMSGKEVI